MLCSAPRMATLLPTGRRLRLFGVSSAPRISLTQRRNVRGMMPSMPAYRTTTSPQWHDTAVMRMHKLLVHKLPAPRPATLTRYLSYG